MKKCHNAQAMAALVIAAPNRVVKNCMTPVIAKSAAITSATFRFQEVSRMSRKVHLDG